MKVTNNKLNAPLSQRVKQLCSIACFALLSSILSSATYAKKVVLEPPFSKSSEEANNKKRWNLSTNNYRSQKAPPKVTTLDNPSIIWTRMRKGFDLPYNEKHPLIAQEIKKISRNAFYVNALKRNAEPYLYYILEQVEQQGLPIELALLPMVESNYNPVSFSKSGAVGLWQIMPATGKMLNLKEDWWYDGKLDVQASTEGALKHLKYLHKQFKGDWLLALAAYNAGEGKIARCIAHNQRLKKPSTFWHLHGLPEETKNYVPKLLALISVIKNPAKYGVALPSIPNKPYFAAVELDTHVDLVKIAQLTNIDCDHLCKLNPGYIRQTTHPEGPWTLMVPKTKATHFQRAAKKVIANKKSLTNHKTYVVKAGDSLEKLAKRHNTTVNAIKQLNQLSDIQLAQGKTIEIPVTHEPIALAMAKAQAQARSGNNKVIHIVQNGDSLWGIGRKYRVTPDKIASSNKIKINEAIQPGQKLVIMTA